MVRFTFSLLMPVVVLAQAALAINKEFVGDEVFSTVMARLETESEEHERMLSLSGDFGDAYQMTGERCGSSGDTCMPGLECDSVGRAGQPGFGKRCLPRQECIKQEMEAWEASFDVQAHKKFIFETAGITEDDLIETRKLHPDNVEYVNSKPIQDLIRTMQEYPGKFDEIQEIVNRCSDPVVDATDDPSDRRMLKVVNATQRQLATGPTISPSAAPSATPSMAPTDYPANTLFLGFHIEAGLILDLSLSVFWKNGQQGGPTWLRGCVGVEFGLGVEFSFFILLNFDGKETDVNCGSFLFDVDVAFIAALGLGVGVCFTQNPSYPYLEFTLGGGLGAGGGFGVCGVLRA